MSRKRKKKLEPGVCPKCKTANPEGAKFCNKCGARLQIVMKGGFEGLVALHIVAALYVLLSAVFNTVLWSSTNILSSVILSLHLVSGVLGLGVAYTLNTGKISRWTKFLSLAMVAAGFVGTTFWFLIASEISGPGWVIFLVTAWKLWQDRHSF